MNLNLVKLIKKYSGKWVAFKPESSVVVTSGNDAVKVYSNAKKKGYKIPILFKVPVKLSPYIG
ncbi:hypothetical protein A3D00_03900 [Candidatus Woesebacteria bacterium RIFCSPHIGHO2_02_FULL_38_9]|uniref:DUF5678 domain-containing protein n=1 Tax=Candidatus Woesebacteria bacterium RIFCSPHIGHO2_01_FULL_39_28 TaxID=1802496 RepID=A0A1F7YJ02_9BACT|nr:MAG: hypothetical protein A2627_03215 [Candidatus Woesebacteria bacterium RIFCSPHIGHO2_01_FULL_39_28]OGM31809.1 MAG: hypothetical protein A3D00_03900 [Candidatus Woesebacteria bacterium RIFCSPHIGHO2_02_FULL_38_9]OGM56940.1 MAG: hypothetical protein A3A50_03560 [Candidatus Woesebacteria bacterium RIFCSPLOWO2_01_FULL_38_20]